jgi:hypothetical protein
MVKTKSSIIKREYEQEMRIGNQINENMKVKERNYFFKVKKIFKEKKEWIVLTDNYYHASWQDV